MLTIDALKEFGADTDMGVRRCAGREALYLKLVAKIPGDKGFGALKEAIAAKDLNAAFEAAHGLKGILGNLSLTPLFENVNDMTEHLRAGEDIDYGPALQRMDADLEKLREIVG